jgi:hypothetical protein
LIPLFTFRVTPKPINHVRIKPQCDLLFDWPKQRTTARATPIALFGYVAGLDLILWERGQSINLSALFGGQMFRNRLLHKLSFRALLPSAH